jgi:hypothetical protein
MQKTGLGHALKKSNSDSELGFATWTCTRVLSIKVELEHTDLYGIFGFIRTSGCYVIHDQEFIFDLRELGMVEITDAIDKMMSKSHIQLQTWQRLRVPSWIYR